MVTFGVRNLAHSFQRVIDEILRRLDFSVSYDILVSSENPHEQHTIFNSRGLVTDIAKCILGAQEMELERREIG